MAEVSVVIVTHERVQLLSELVDRLVLQSVRPEIVVIDDGTLEPAPQVAALCQVYEWCEHTTYQRVARFNQGVRLASGDYVILLDDDMLPTSEHFVQAHLQGLAHAHACLGRGIDSAGQAVRPPWFSSANLALVRHLAVRLGPFDLAYNGRYGYEDHDLGLALERGGWAVTTGSPETATVHRGAPYAGDRVSAAANKAYYCQKWGIPNA